MKNKDELGELLPKPDRTTEGIIYAINIFQLAFVAIVIVAFIWAANHLNNVQP